MALINGLQTTITGLKANQAQIDLISRNITNINTPGYSRKSYMQKSVVLNGQGVGVSLSKVMRQVDEGLLKSFLSANSLFGTMASSNKYLSDIETVIGSPLGDNSLSSDVSNIHKMFENLANNVTSSAVRHDLVSYANNFTNRINSMSQSIQKTRAEADQAISQEINNINEILDRLSELNVDIVKYNALGYDGVTDLLDQRDNHLRDLSGYLDISYFTRETGEIVIQTVDGISILDKEPHKLSHSPISQASSLTSYNGGGIQGIFIEGIDITTKIQNGTIKGLIDVRDNNLPSLQSQLDELAKNMMVAINKEHNKGTAFPELANQMEGTRSFVDSAGQQIKIENGDVRFSIFDRDGNQVSTALLGQNMGFNSGDIDSMAAAINTWLQSPTGANLPTASAFVDTSTGKLVIETGDSEYGISIMDVETVSLGAKQQNVTIQFDNNGDGVFDQTHEGFSNFFGLNDFFTVTKDDIVYDSKIMNLNVKLGLTSVSTLSFSDKTNGLNYASIDIYPGEKLQDIVNKINNDPVIDGQIKALLVPSGNGYILRIINETGEQLEITETTPTNLLEKIAMEKSNALSSMEMRVREDLSTTPDLISVGSPEFDITSGKYIISSSTNNIANLIADTLTKTHSFQQSGNLTSTNSSFEDYTATFIGVIASSINTSNQSLKYQSSLLESIQTKEAQISQVDKDEELANLIIFKQSYEACAQAFNVSKEMIDLLLNMV